MERRPLVGQRALVTGASSGIGADLARELAARGAELVITARRQDRLEVLAAELQQHYGVQVQVQPLDLALPGAAQTLFESTEGADQPIDVLVNNAGVGMYQDFIVAPWERYSQMLQLNVVALTHLTHLVLPQMVRRRRGYVMNVASIGAYIPTPQFAVYASSKAYVRNFTEALGHELRGTEVRAIAVCPGATRTEFMDSANQTPTGGGDFFFMTSRRCARIAVRKMLRGRRNVVTGWLNALGMWLLRLVPRALMPALARRFMGVGVEKTQ